MPPGQAKKWRRGYPLDRDVIFYDLPPTIVARIGLTPSGYRYVRVASDILMIAVGTGLVVDAVADLTKMSQRAPPAVSVLLEYHKDTTRQPRLRTESAARQANGRASCGDRKCRDVKISGGACDYT